MGYKQYKGWDTKPKLDEARVLAPEAPPHSSRGRKNTRKWCRGKEGVEHKLETRVSKWGVSILTRFPESDYAGCGWRQRSRWTITATEGRSYGPIPGEWRYNCNHEEYCTECGRIMKHQLRANDCPLWKPREHD